MANKPVRPEFWVKMEVGQLCATVTALDFYLKTKFNTEHLSDQEKIDYDEMVTEMKYSHAKLTELRRIEGRKFSSKQ